jgi:hypothetical protein
MFFPYSDINPKFHVHIQQNVVVECLTLILCISKVQGSDLSPQTGYPEFIVILLSPSVRMQG